MTSTVVCAVLMTSAVVRAVLMTSADVGALRQRDNLGVLGDLGVLGVLCALYDLGVLGVFCAPGWWKVVSPELPGRFDTVSVATLRRFDDGDLTDSLVSSPRPSDCIETLAALLLVTTFVLP